jgi:hypothetical protein
MKIVIIQKWPVWLKKQVSDRYFSNMKQLEVENDDSFVPPNSIQCLPDNYPNEMDIAAKTLAITNLKNICEKIENDVDTIVLMNGIEISGTVSPVDFVYTKNNIDVSKRADIINLLSGLDKKEGEGKGEEGEEGEGKGEEGEGKGEEGGEGEEGEGEEGEEYLPPQIINENESINDIILKRRESMNEDMIEEEDEPRWLQEAADEQRSTNTLQIENSEKIKDESVEDEIVTEVTNVTEFSKDEEKSDELIADISQSQYTIDSQVEGTKSNTFVVSNDVIVLELKGVLLPSVICALAPQRVIVPLENGSVVMISGTKKIVRIAQWTIDVESFNEKTCTYNSTSGRNSSSHGYDLRNYNNNVIKSKSIALNREKSKIKGTIKTLHSLKKLQYQRR